MRSSIFRFSVVALLLAAAGMAQGAPADARWRSGVSLASFNDLQICTNGITFQFADFAPNAYYSPPPAGKESFTYQVKASLRTGDPFQGPLLGARALTLFLNPTEETEGPGPGKNDVSGAGRVEWSVPAGTSIDVVVSSFEGGFIGGGGWGGGGGGGEDLIVQDCLLPDESKVFGTGRVGRAIAALSSNKKYTSPFRLKRATTVTELRVYLDGQGGGVGSQRLRGIIYADSAGRPGALVASTLQRPIRARTLGEWVDFTFFSAVQLTPGRYWLGIQAGKTKRVARFAFEPRKRALASDQDVFTDGPTSPFGGPKTTNMRISIFAFGS